MKYKQGHTYAYRGKPVVLVDILGGVEHIEASVVEEGATEEQTIPLRHLEEYEGVSLGYDNVLYAKDQIDKAFEDVMKAKLDDDITIQHVSSLRSKWHKETQKFDGFQYYFQLEWWRGEYDGNTKGCVCVNDLLEYEQAVKWWEYLAGVMNDK